MAGAVRGWTPPPSQDQLQAQYAAAAAGGVQTPMGQAMMSPQFQASKDYAQRVAGIDPANSLQGPSYYTMGGRTFANTRGADLGTFKGELGSFGTDMSQYIRGQEAMNQIGDPKQRGSAVKQSALSRQYGDMGYKRGQDLLETFGTLTGSQRDQMIQETGLSVDQLVKFQLDRNQRPKNGVMAPGNYEIQNYNPAIDRTAETMLQQSIQQRQTSSGLFQSQSAAAAEGGAMAALQTGRMAQVSPVLMLGAVDPQKMHDSRVQMPLSQLPMDVALGNNPGGRDPRRNQPTYANNNPGRFGTIDYNQVNLLGANQKDPFALMYGMGAGGFFGA